MLASIRTVKNRFSEFVRRVRLGEEIIVTSRDVPVAKLVPLAEEEQVGVASREVLLRELEALRADLGEAVDGAPLSRTVVELRAEDRY